MAFSCINNGAGSKHGQILGRELEIVITLGIGEEEVGLLVVLGDGLLLKYEFVSFEDGRRVQFVGKKLKMPGKSWKKLNCI